MSQGLSSWLGPALIVLGLLGLAAFRLAGRRGLKPALRRLDGYEAVPEQVGQVIESGGRLHVSLGPNSIVGRETGVTLAGLAMLDATTNAAAAGDRPVLATTADGTALWVMSDVTRRAAAGRRAEGGAPAEGAFLVALDSTALAGGLTSLTRDEDVRASVLFGSFGPEVALAAEAGHRANIPQTVASDRLDAQAAGYAMADHLLIGEELFAARAYLDERPGALAGLLTQDVLRWLVVGLIVIGALLQTLGLLR